MDPRPTTAPEARFLNNQVPLTKKDAKALIQALTGEPEPAYIHTITALLRAGKDPKQILDVIQVAAAGVVLQVGEPNNFSMPQHGYEYTNTLRWFFDNFEHPYRLRLLYVAGSFINQAAFWVRHTPDNGNGSVRAPKGAERLSGDDMLRRLDQAMMALQPAESAAWTKAYLAAGYDRQALLQTLALGAVKQGNDPHNQEIGLCFVEDYRHSTAHDREVLLLACAYHTAGHVKYGDPLQAYRRFTEALAL
jgi:hypothetical protein